MTAARTIPPRPWMTAPGVRAVMDALAGAGGAVRFVGGCVRDAVLGRDPDGDVDIATTLPPDRASAALQAAGVRVVPTGIDHGTVTAIAGGAHYEVTTLREDVRTDGRRAEVAFTDDWRADAARRDFTINAMSMTEAGEVHDYFGGLGDLAAGRVRFVGDAETRIREDVLRVLRFFRFHARYGRGAPDAAALAAAERLAGLVPGLSGERVWAELGRILTGPGPDAALGLMTGAGVLRQVVPEAVDHARLGALAAIEAARGIVPPSPVRRLAAALATDAEGARAVAGRLRMSRAERERLAGLAEGGVAVPPDLAPATARRAIYREGAAPWRDRVLLSWAAARARGAGDGVDAAYAALLAVADDFVPPELPVGGEDAKALGLDAGPALGAALRAVEDWWLAEDFRPGREECLAKLRAAVRP